MRRRVLFFLSLALNVALGVLWLVTARRLASVTRANLESTAPSVVKTNVVVRRQFFSWAQVESSDFPAYIANLREIGCPEQTIRDIIIADVNSLYARRLAAEIVTPEQQWWRSEPDTKVVQAAAQKARELNEERRALLTRLLGPNWESHDLAGLPRPSRPNVVLDGKVLGGLPDDVKQAVQEINVRAQERLQAYLNSQRLAGQSPDPVELVKLRQQTRDELARTLTPPQVEEYLLRYSQSASNLRSELGRLKYFDATPDEFRGLFRATDAIDQQVQFLEGSIDPNSAVQRNALLEQREIAVKNALGPDRYKEYVQLQDPLYRDAFAAAQRAGDPAAAQTLYEINLATAEQQAAIRSNTNLTPEQMAAQLKWAEAQQLTAYTDALGQNGPPAETPAATNAPPQISSHPYVLGFGETASSIALNFGVSLKAIQAVNPAVNLTKLRPGDTILVPDFFPMQ